MTEVLSVPPIPRSWLGHAMESVPDPVPLVPDGLDDKSEKGNTEHLGSPAAPASVPVLEPWKDKFDGILATSEKHDEIPVTQPASFDLQDQRSDDLETILANLQNAEFMYKKHDEDPNTDAATKMQNASRRAMTAINTLLAEELIPKLPPTVTLSKGQKIVNELDEMLKNSDVPSRSKWGAQAAKEMKNQPSWMEADTWVNKRKERLKCVPKKKAEAEESFRHELETEKIDETVGEYVSFYKIWEHEGFDEEGWEALSVFRRSRM